MKKKSAKLKLTLWTSLLMTAMAVIIIALLFSLSGTIAESNSKKQLMDVVQNNIQELEYDDGELEYDDIDFFKNGVYTLLYTEDGKLIQGNFPEDYSRGVTLSDKETTEITIDGTPYYIYDILSPVDGGKYSVWVRGVTAAEVSGTTNSILQIALFSLPIFIVLGTIGCYIIAKLTFRPIDKIVKTADDISSSEDLTLRINLENSSEEIYKLASTFDNMLDRIEGAFEAEKQFSQNVSHELRTPTAVILAQCEYALGDKACNEDKQEALQVVNKQATRMSRLISELLSLIRLERGIEKPEFATIDLSELVNIVCDEQSIVAQSNITLNQNIADNIKITANQTMIIRLISNLLSNAYRYGKEHGNINVVLSENATEIILSVQDDGIGIADEHIDKIWQRFYQVDNARTGDRSGSMGLGLSMVLEIAKIHKAKVTVNSEIQKGSIFTIIFSK